MTWHQTASDDAWKRVTMASVHELGHRIWLRCNGCGHELLTDPIKFGAIRDVDTATPLLTIARRLRCTGCGERKAHCWPEPYAIKRRET